MPSQHIAPMHQSSTTPSERLRRGFFLIFLLLAGGGWAWWAAYDRAAAGLRLVLWLCAIGLYLGLRALSDDKRFQVAALLAILNGLLGVAVLLSVPLPFSQDTLGGILAVFLPLATILRPHIRWIVLLAALAALLVTREYGAWIGLMVAIGAWMTAPWVARHLKGLPRPHKYSLTPFVGGALSLGFLLLLGWPALLDRLQVIPIPWEDLHTRLQFARNTLYLIADYPLGGGFGAFSGLYSRYILGIAYVFIASSHNLFLDLALEQGILALGAFLFLWSRSAVTALLKGEAPLPRAVLAGLLVLVVHGLFEAPLYTGLALPLLLIPLALAPEMPPAPPWTARLRPLWYAAVLLPAFALGVLQYPVTRQAQIELQGWPQTRPEQTASSALQPLIPAYERNLRLFPAHFADHYRLGLIAQGRRDFSDAAAHLQLAAQRKPAHPGVHKALAYALVWTGDLQSALPLLRTLPEAQQDLGHYIRWWPTQGRPDLSERAQQALQALQAMP